MLISSSLLLIIALLSHPSSSLKVKGNNTYLYTAKDFKDFANEVSRGKTYLWSTVFLEADIDLSGYTGSIGDDSKSFDGTFDGQGHVIDKLVPGKAKYTGLFGRTLKGITIRNLVMGESGRFEPQNIYHEAFTGILVAKCNAVYNDCRVENVVTLSTLACTTTFVRYNYLGAAFGGCEAHLGHICYVRNMVNYGQLHYSSASSSYLDLGGIMGYCYGSSGTVKPACLIENAVNYGSVIYSGIMVPDLAMGGFIARAEIRTSIVNVAQFGSVNSPNRLDNDYYIGTILGDSKGGSTEFEENTVSRALWSSTLTSNRNKPLDRKTNTDDSDIVASFDPATFVIDPTAGAGTERLVDFFNEYVESRNAELKEGRKINSAENEIEQISGLYPWAKVQFNTYGGSTILPRAFILMPYYSSLIYPIETPKKDGVDFVGWFTDGAFTKKYNSSLLSAGCTITLHAKWSSYFVRFDSNGGSDFSSHNKQYKYGVTFSLPTEVPTRTGHTFLGWIPQDTITAADSNKYYTPNHDVTFKAVWEAKTYMVRLYIANESSSKGVSLFREYEISYNDTIRFPNNVPEKAGYALTEWVPTSGNPTKVGAEYFMPEHDVSFAANWTIGSYTVLFMAERGDTAETALSNKTVLYNSTFTTPDTAPDKEGYKFAGWECADSDVKKDPATGEYVMPAHDTIFYVKWSVRSYTVTYLDNTSALLGSDEVNYNAPVPYPHKVSGDETMYWYLETTRTNEAPALMPAKNFTAYGIWNTTRYYFTVVTVPVTSVETTILYKGDILPLPSANPTRDGYTFSKWSEDEGCTGAAFSSTTMGTSDITIYACWSALKFNVTLYSNDKLNETSSLSIRCGYPLNIGAFVRSGYVLDGWCEDANCVEGFFTDAVMPARSIVLYAQWSPALFYLCTDTNHEDSSVSCALVAFDDNISFAYSIPRNPGRSGYVFVGWSTDPSYKASSDTKSSSKDTGLVDISTAKMPASNLTLYTVWKEKGYVVFFVPGNENNATAYKEYSYGATIDFPSYTRENYVVSGWYTNDTFDNESLFDSTTMPSKSVVLYLKWTGVLYSVSFETNKGNKINPVSIEYDTPVDFNKDYVPLRKKYEFGGWFLDKSLNEKCTYKKMPGQDLKLYARWKNAATSLHPLSLLSIVICLLFAFF